MGTARVQFQRKAVYHRGVIACAKCAAPMHVYKLKPLPEEFSVRCTKCGERGHYSRREMNVQELPERRRKPRD